MHMRTCVVCVRSVFVCGQILESVNGEDRELLEPFTRGTALTWYRCRLPGCHSADAEMLSQNEPSVDPAERP